MGEEVPHGRQAALEPASQRAISAEIAAIHATDDGRALTQPRLDFAPYRSSALRHPTKDLCHADPETVELAAPVFGHRDVDPLEADLTIQHGGEPLGERITVSGRVLDGDGRPVRGQLVEIWQANAAGRYATSGTNTRRRSTPTSPASAGASPTTTGRYAFTTVKPGAVPVAQPPQRLAARAHPLLRCSGRRSPSAW